MSLSLDYSFVKYQDELFYQHRGIEMGNAASVAVANITVYHELKDLFTGKSELAFFRRFLDDIFMIVDTSNIDNLDNWLESLFNHKYLKFTYEYSESSINFLDTSISLGSDNSIVTCVYSKPMSRHLYLHATSNHPIHLKNSLFYSQGLRIIRICSNANTSIETLMKLQNKFVERGYAKNVLDQIFTKLTQVDRKAALKPKGELLIDHLSCHNPAILQNFNMTKTVVSVGNVHNNPIYAIFPFFGCIRGYSKIIKNVIHEHITSQVEQSVIKLESGELEDISIDIHSVQSLIHNSTVQVVYKRTPCIREKLK